MCIEIEKLSADSALERGNTDKHTDLICSINILYKHVIVVSIFLHIKICDKVVCDSDKIRFRRPVKIIV